MLRDTAWLPDVDGNYRKPAELSIDSLDKAFHIDSDSPFLAAIEFGKEESERRKQLEEEERRRTSEYQEKSNAAQTLGLNDMAEFEEMRRKAELYDRAEAEGRIAPKTQIEEPTANTNHPEKRTTAVIETTNGASDRTYEQKARSVRVTKIRSEATIKNIFVDGELAEDTTVRKFRTVQRDLISDIQILSADFLQFTFARSVLYCHKRKA